MIIKRLTMHNFGVYAGTNTFDFSGNKPVVLIGGLNGRGKTTFLEAVLLALYGANSFAYKESSYKTYGKYLRSYVNRNDWTKTSYIEIEFLMASDEDETYLVHREWNALKERTSEEITVRKNGQVDEFLTQNWPMFIENVLPSALSNFFFFDGEKIADLAVDDTGEQMKSSIRAMLGLSVLDVLNNDLNRMVSKLSKIKAEDTTLQELMQLRNDRDAKEKELSDVDEKINDASNTVAELNAKIEEAKLQFTASGGDALGNRQELFEQRGEINYQIEQGKEELFDMAAGALPLALVGDLLESISEKSHKNQDSRILSRAMDKMSELYADYIQMNPDRADDQFLKFMTAAMSADLEGESTGISENTMMVLDDLLKTGLQQAKSEAATLMESQAALKEKKDLIDGYLSVDINEQDIQKSYKDLLELERKKAEAEISLVNLQNSRSAVNGEFIKLAAAYNRQVEEMLSTLELEDDADRKIKYAHIAANILVEYNLRLQKKKVNLLADTITDCYKRLANKKTLISQIKIDPTSLEISYIGEKGAVIPREKLSAGEKQLMVISILWALAKCSKKKLPVIIDTPLSRLDSTHRTALIKTYFPNASEQTIILSTDTEIDAKYYKIMKDSIGDEFCLIYDEDTKSTSIQRGYFQ